VRVQGGISKESWVDLWPTLLTFHTPFRLNLTENTSAVDLWSVQLDVSNHAILSLNPVFNFIHQINRNFVVTAAHCVAGYASAGRWSITVGEQNRGIAEDHEQSIQVLDIVTHKDFLVMFGFHRYTFYMN